MKTFKCWVDGNSDEDNAKEYVLPLAYGADEAATRHAAFRFDRDDYAETQRVRVHVRCPNGDLYAFDVEARQEVSFCATAVKMEGGK